MSNRRQRLKDFFLGLGVALELTFLTGLIEDLLTVELKAIIALFGLLLLVGIYKS